MTATTLDLRPLDDRFGAELALDPGDLDEPGAVAGAIVDGLLRADLVVIPGAALDEGHHAAVLTAVGNRWHQVTGSDAAFGPSIADGPIRITDLDVEGGEDSWQEPFTVHAGWSLAAPWWAEPPALGSLAVGGPDGSSVASHLASTAIAHDRLSPAFQTLFADLDALHDRHRGGSWPAAGGADGIHPIVHLDARTGRRHVIVSADHTVLVEGHTRPASRKLIAFLAGHLAQPEHTITQRWGAGTLAVWVNAAVARRPIQPPDGAAEATTRSLAAGGRPVRHAA